jgi:hypothetical protein
VVTVPVVAEEVVVVVGKVAVAGNHQAGWSRSCKL